MATLDALFDATSRSFGSNVAVTFNSGSMQEHITYNELEAQVSKVKTFLKTVCKGQETVALYSKQSISLVSCILGVLKSGNCFAPIDLNWLPDMVCKFLLKLSVHILFLEEDLRDSFENCLLQWKTSLPEGSKVEFVWNQVLANSGFIPIRRLDELKEEKPNTENQGLAYVMQTSGTTGEAKVIRVPHMCIVPNIIDLRNIFQVTSEDVIFLTSPYTFDPFIVQMFTAFAAGARLVIVPDSVKMVPSKLCNILFDEERVTILQPTPSLMYHIGQELIQSKILSKDSSLRVLAFGGETCPTLSTLGKWRSLQSKTSIYNLYGITEVSCWASCHKITDCKLENGSGDLCENVTFRHRDLENYSAKEVNDSKVPLGAPLSDTIIEVQDENGEIVSEGVGQIYIGGSNRVCLLNNETQLQPGTMRATGDWAFVKDNTICYRGRKDRQIKRMGKRINLDWIEQQISEQIPGITCSLVLDKTATRKLDKLHLFIVSKSLSHDDNELSSFKRSIWRVLPVDAQPDSVHMISHLPMTAHGKVNRGSLLVEAQKRTKLKDMSTREFLRYAWNEVLGVSETSGEEKVFTDNVKKQAKDLFHIKQRDFKEDDMFISCGGSSLNAVRLMELIETFVTEEETEVDLSELLDIILTKPFGVLCNYLEGKLNIPNERNDLSSKETHHLHEDTNKISPAPSSSVPFEEIPVLSTKRLFSTLADAASHYNSKAAKKIQALEENKDSNITALSDVTELKTCFCSMQRQNQFNVCNICKHSTPSTDGVVASKAQTFSASQARVSASAVPCEVAGSPLIPKVPDQFFSSVQDHKGSMAVNPDTRNFNIAEGKVSVSCHWRTCLYKCIDASPLVVHAPGRSEGEVFIGSHSHVFMCIRLSDGKVLWESRLGDRIESSAALSLCGRYVVVGCYDGQVYVLSRFTGEISWTFQTGAAVKSSPCIDPQTGLAWVGSHDHHLYVLDVTNRQCIAAIHCGGGSCFSSPCISKKPHLVFIATLTGCLLAIDATKHTVLWSQQCPKPVFASPLLTPIGIVCACVNGFVYCFDFQCNKLWEFETQASVFCSSTLYQDVTHDCRLSGCIVFGSHDKCVYCLSLNGELSWSFTTDGPVYSSPYVAMVNSNISCHSTDNAGCCDKCDTQLAVFALSSVGTLYILDFYSGVLLAFYSLPGEVFSSPVVVDNQILIGCRDNYLYSLNILYGTKK